MESPLYTNPLSATLTENLFLVNSFFGTVLAEYYLILKSNDLDFKGEGYVGIKGENISFFNDKMEPMLTVPLNTVLSANASGKYQDDITMSFQDNVSVNAER